MKFQIWYAKVLKYDGNLLLKKTIIIKNSGEKIEVIKMILWKVDPLKTN